jgi:hypothetical protein
MQQAVDSDLHTYCRKTCTDKDISTGFVRGAVSKGPLEEEVKKPPGP